MVARQWLLSIGSEACGRKEERRTMNLARRKILSEAGAKLREMQRLLSSALDDITKNEW